MVQATATGRNATAAATKSVSATGDGERTQAPTTTLVDIPHNGGWRRSIVAALRRHRWRRNVQIGSAIQSTEGSPNAVATGDETITVANGNKNAGANVQ